MTELHGMQVVGTLPLIVSVNYDMRSKEMAVLFRDGTKRVYLNVDPPGHDNWWTSHYSEHYWKTRIHPAYLSREEPTEKPDA